MRISELDSPYRDKVQQPARSVPGAPQSLCDTRGGSDFSQLCRSAHIVGSVEDKDYEKFPWANLGDVNLGGADLSRTPLGRMGEELDVVGPIIFLASDLSSYGAGHDLVVDEGFSAW